jgi:hypothetical protein
MSLFRFFGYHLIPISPFHKQSRRDAQIPFDLPRILPAALEQFQGL